MITSNVIIYGHFGSQNHGNEAIVRGVSKLFGHKHIMVYSYTPDADKKYELDGVCNIRPFLRMYKRYSPIHILIALWSRLIKNQNMNYAYRLKPFFQDIKGIYMLEAGDQYCEDDSLKYFYAYINQKIIQRGGKTVMLPCTISEEALTNTKTIEDLHRYSLIFARESITYNALLNAGLGKNTRFAPCPAFIMEPKECDLPKIFSTRSMVGLTIGILAQGKESYTNAVFENSRALIQHIINNTDFAVSLIPHVNVGKQLTDVTLMHELYNEFKDTGRIVEINERRADEQKYIIKNCRFLVAVRTHASIAAYSSGVPTLVIGYSQKSKGIAKDLFGTSENFIVNIESLNTNDKLTKAFVWLEENENHIRKNLNKVLPSYLQKVRTTYEEIVKLAGEYSD